MNENPPLNRNIINQNMQNNRPVELPKEPPKLEELPPEAKDKLTKEQQIMHYINDFINKLNKGYPDIVSNKLANSLVENYLNSNLSPEEVQKKLETLEHSLVDKYVQAYKYKMGNEKELFNMKSFVTGNKKEYEQELNNKAKKYLSYIIQEYEKYYLSADLPAEKRAERQAFLESLLNESNLIVVEDNYDNYINNQLKTGEELEHLPDAHGARTFNDGKIHLYPYTESDRRNIDGTIVHELMHFFIRPESLKELPPELRDKLSENFKIEKFSEIMSEASVDMCARDIINKYNISTTYDSNYNRYVVFLRVKIASLATDKEKYNLIFNGSVEDIMNVVPDKAEEFLSEFDNVNAMNSDVDKLADKIVNVIQAKPGHEDEIDKLQDQIRRSIYKIIADAESLDVGIQNVKDIIPEGIRVIFEDNKKELKEMITLTPDEIQADMIKEIKEYLKNSEEDIKEETQKTEEKFDFKDSEEDEFEKIAEDNHKYLLENPLPSMENKQVKSNEKKHKQLVLQQNHHSNNNNNSNENKGFISIIALIGVIILMMGIISLITYYLISR